MRERKDREKEARRKVILEAATRIFSQKGFAATTMEDVADRAELSVGTLYLYFRSKEEIYLSMILDAMDVFHEGLVRIAESRRGPAEKRRAVWELFIRFREEHPMYYKALLYLHDADFTRYLSPAVRSAVLDRSGRNFSLGARILSPRGKESRPSKRAIDLMWAAFLGLVYIQDSRANLSESFDPARSRSFLLGAFEFLENGLAARSGGAG